MLQVSQIHSSAAGSHLPCGILTSGTFFAEHNEICKGSNVITHLESIKTEGNLKVSRRRRNPNRILKLIQILENYPSGLESCEISHHLQGAVRYSCHKDALEEARIATTRKLIQRAKVYLIKTDSSRSLYFCKNRKVWLIQKSGEQISPTTRQN